MSRKPLDAPGRFPACEKLAEVAPLSNKLGEFLDWLREEGLVLCRVEQVNHREWYTPDTRGFEKLLAAYFGIDLTQVELEWRALLAGIRVEHERGDGP